MNKPQCDYSLTDASLQFLSYPRDFLEKNVRPVLICASQTVLVGHTVLPWTRMTVRQRQRRNLWRSDTGPFPAFAPLAS